MKKILLPFTGSSVSPSLIHFGCYMAHLSQASLTGVFLSSDDGHKEPVKMDAEQSIRFFRETCAERGVQATVSVRGRSARNATPVEEVVHESRFADVVILDPELGGHGRGDVPSAVVREIVSKAECPAILAPTLFDQVDEVVFCYDGQRSSVYAVKQFTYLFPEFKNKKLTLLEVCEDSDCFTEKEQIDSWLRSNYMQVHFKLLNGTPDDELLQYFLLRKNVFIVMGAYGRSLLSSFFKRSSADLVLRVMDLPVFIAHHK
jgi:nucleotide-binding universal stress UspA family protein